MVGPSRAVVVVFFLAVESEGKSLYRNKNKNLSYSVMINVSVI